MQPISYVIALEKHKKQVKELKAMLERVNIFQLMLVVTLH
jgi:hypothetical protein